jgi:hypothetical protein
MLIYKKVSEMMANLPAIEKKSKHQQGYTYRSFDDFLAVFKPALVQHGLILVPEVVNCETGLRPSGRDKEACYAAVTVAYTLFAEDGSSIRAVVAGESNDFSDKATAKAMTNALKSFFIQTFCVPVKDDADEGERESHREPQRSASKPTQQDSNVSEIESHLTSKANNLIKAGRVEAVGEGYRITDADTVYRVKNSSCECGRFAAARKCEHVIATQLLRAA